VAIGAGLGAALFAATGDVIWVAIGPAFGAPLARSSAT
jgi:hypothetical protein